ncbi:hypothetical protein [Gluconobacter morbifer]|uniref:hypothetical protein n=1 Tax=Gluconobacter morbifer TaxID=479935 RepID=UPI001111D3DB|nr:hypothetical protein [Gluconobacter morbifer]
MSFHIDFPQKKNGFRLKTRQRVLTEKEMAIEGRETRMGSRGMALPGFRMTGSALNNRYKLLQATLNESF